jgi:LuxR family maltose regulon positive regulatory protein
MWGRVRGLHSELPAGYYLDREPDIRRLRQLDGFMVGPRTVLSTIERTAPGEASAPEASLSALRARFFGHFELLCDGEPITLRRNGKVPTILKYLLAHRARPVSQDHLMGWLWPESNLKKARWSLNSAIHNLRKLLSTCPSSAPVNYVLFEEGHYRLSPTIRIATDVDEFDARYEEGRRLEKANRIEEAAVEYEEAVELYRGDYLLEDLYEDWTMVERERLLNAYVDMLWRLADYYTESGQPRECIRTCYRLLEKERCHEESYRLLMRSYLSLGLRDRALHHYRLCAEALEQAYDTVPSSETKALHRSILLGEEIG